MSESGEATQMKKRKKNLSLLFLICLIFIIKVSLLFIFPSSLTWPPDEQYNYQVAQNYNDGLGYVIFNEETNTYKVTAFHDSFPVFLYALLIKWGIQPKAYAFFIQLLSIILFCFSIIYFYKLCSLYIKQPKYQLIATIAYCFFPSTIFYIGSLFLYENIVLPLFVIIIYRLGYSLQNDLSPSDFILLPILITLSCLLRGQFLFMILIVLFIYFFIAGKKEYFKRKVVFIGVIFLVLVLSFLPIMHKNYKMFNSYLLSTKPGFALLIGHNAYAKGSFDANFELTNKHFKENSNKDIDKLNEYQLSREYGKEAIEWVLQNPLKELKLIFKKIAIYFLPKNFSVLPLHEFLNPINLIIYMLFFLYIFTRIKSKTIPIKEILLFSPIFASVLFSLIFFVGYRWRYYAEPFIIILAFIFIEEKLNIYFNNSANKFKHV